MYPLRGLAAGGAHGRQDANPDPNPNPNPDPNPNPNPTPEQVRKGSIDLPAKKLPSSVGVSLPVIGSVRVNLVSTHTGPQALASPI